MPTEPTAPMLIGAAFFFSGALFCIVTLIRASELAMGMQGWRNTMRFFSDPSRKSVKRLCAVAFAVTVCGGLLTCGSLMASDAKRNNRCTEACEQHGFPKGRFRGDPHVPFRPGDAYGCWCQRAEEWSAEPVAF